MEIMSYAAVVKYPRGKGPRTKRSQRRREAQLLLQLPTPPQRSKPHQRTRSTNDRETALSLYGPTLPATQLHAEEERIKTAHYLYEKAQKERAEKTIRLSDSDES